MSQPILQTPRLALRPFTLADARTVQRLANDPQVARSTLNIPHPYPDGIAETWIASHREAFAARESVVYAVTLQASGELCGSVSLVLDWRHVRAEIGYWLGVAYWGQGIMTEAAQALINYGFDEWGLNRIYAYHFASNPASGRVMQKTGMRYEGHLRQHMRKDGLFEDSVCYGMLREEWQKTRSWQPV